jgi:hypothetical protein
MTSNYSRLRLKKRTSINSISDFHKEKEMADFRKWLLALAAVAVLLGLGSATANAATFTCQTNAGNPTIIRAEGVAELVGDLTLNCTGGTPTAAGQAIPLSSVQISLNTNVTSRLIDASNASEAVLLIDEPYPSAGGAAPQNPTLAEGGGQAAASTGAGATLVSGNATTQLGCLAINNLNCAIISLGPGTGAGGSYNGSVTGITGSHYNVFQGIQIGVNTIAWQGVPIDAPGTAGTRVIRITNIRANACLLGVSSTFIPTQITELIGISGSQNIQINNPNQLVAEAEQGLIVTTGTGSFAQCNNLNATLLDGTGGATGGPITISATEGFDTAFKVRNINQILAGSGFGPGAGTGGTANTLDPDSDVGLQNIPGFSYNTESGFIPGQIGTASPGGGYDSGGTGNGSVGLASQGTEISFTFSGVQAGVTLSVPGTIALSSFEYGTDAPGEAVLIGGTGGGSQQLTVSGTTATATYEILYEYPTVVETLPLPVSVAFLTTGPPVPGVGVATVAVNFAPLSTSPTASAVAPIPRFCQPYAPANLFSINLCSCNLLFPFVTNQAGFDTGVAIANTTADTLNAVTPQTGNVTLTYYGGTTGGGAAPATAVTTSAVPSGQELLFTLSGGGNFGIPATPGFEGYIIARADFQYCHGFAFISDAGAQKLAEGYLAIQLDMPGLYRTGQVGENLGH